MKLPKWRSKHPAGDDKLHEAERRARDLAERAERVAESLEGRLRRNHWGQTVAQIARREQS